MIMEKTDAMGLSLERSGERKVQQILRLAPAGPEVRYHCAHLTGSVERRTRKSPCGNEREIGGCCRVG
jgi:hypothetical protein